MPAPPAARRDELDARHLGSEQVARYLRRHGLTAQKRFSQNHLIDGTALESIVAAAEPAGRDILEIGPGIGILTGALLGAGARSVTAVEVDHRLVDHLRRRFSGDRRLTVVGSDVLDVDKSSLVSAPYDLVANLPYHITSPVLHWALAGEPRPRRMVLMVQREVAERITAPPGGLSYLSVFVQYHSQASLVRVVPAASFEPAPRVDSAIIRGVVLPRRLSGPDEQELWRLVQAGFRERRKMLHNVLSRQLPLLGRERLADALARAGIASDRRPQTVSVEEWLALSAALGPLP